MTRCGQCKHYAVLHKSRDNVFGFCFKDFREGQRSAYPVYLPDSGSCKSFLKAKENRGYEYEMTQEYRCECCRKEIENEIFKVIRKIGK